MLPRFSRSVSSVALLAALLAPAGRATAQSAVDVAGSAFRATDGLTSRLDTWYQITSRRAPGQWGIAVADETGRLLWSVNPDQQMVPASTVKLFTTGFARSVLGEPLGAPPGSWAWAG